MSLYNEAYDVIGDSQDVTAIMELARKYYAGKQSADPIWEYPSDSAAENLRDITFMLHE